MLHKREKPRRGPGVPSAERPHLLRSRRGSLVGGSWRIRSRCPDAARWAVSRAVRRRWGGAYTESW